MPRSRGRPRRALAVERVERCLCITQLEQRLCLDQQILVVCDERLAIIRRKSLRADTGHVSREPLPRRRADVIRRASRNLVILSQPWITEALEQVYLILAGTHEACTRSGEHELIPVILLVRVARLVGDVVCRITRDAQIGL